MGNIHYLLPFSPGALHSSGVTCPRCQASVFRVSRRVVDMLLSVFMPVRRYRCISIECSWEGNLRARRTSLPDKIRT